MNKYHSLPTGFLIKVRYYGPTDYKGSRWIATYRRSSDKVFRAVVAYEDHDNHHAAALACLAKINKEREAALPGDQPFILICAAHDCDAYYYVATYSEAES
jgi:hypothetical protein